MATTRVAGCGGRQLDRDSVQGVWESGAAQPGAAPRPIGGACRGARGGAPRRCRDPRPVCRAPAACCAEARTRPLLAKYILGFQLASYVARRSHIVRSVGADAHQTNNNVLP